MVDLTADAGMPVSGGVDSAIRGALTRLALAAAGVVAAPVWLATVAVAQVDRSQEFSTFAPFNGWQVWTVEAALGAAFGTTAWLSLRAAKSLIRELRGRTQYRRLLCIVGLVMGLLVGWAAVTPIRAAISWASDHTAERAHYAAQVRQERLDYRSHPPVLRVYGSPAPSELAAKLLHPSDLGSGWYDGTSPNPSRVGVSAEMKRLGGLVAASTDLDQQTWDGRSWHLGALLLQSVRQFPSDDAARSFAALDTKEIAASASRKGVRSASLVRLRAVTVSEWALPRTRLAAWVAGRHFYTINATGGTKEPSAAEFARWVALAVDRSVG